jgi:hypothetical protein
VAENKIAVRRDVKVTLDAPTIGGLIAQLQDLTTKPAIGTDSQVARIDGGGTSFDLILVKPD